MTSNGGLSSVSCIPVTSCPLTPIWRLAIVQRIYRQLEVEGITFTRRGVGTFLSEDPELAERLRSTILEQEVTAFLKKMQQYHFSKAALFTAMEQQLEQAEKKEETETTDKN